MSQEIIIPPISPKSRAAAALLCFFLGMIGVHRFYVGKVGTGFLMFLGTITIVGWWIIGIWNIVDFIVILAGQFKDKENRLITNWG